ncbi:MAG: LPXTG cell wall anchor domain-containing protein [Actinomycetota bacterium]
MKRFAFMLALGVIIVSMLVIMIPAFAQAQYDTPGTPAPAAAGAEPAAAAPSGTSGTTSSGGAKTGAEVLVLALAGASLVGAGYVLTRKART